MTPAMNSSPPLIEFAVPAALFVYADPTMAYGKVTRFIADAFPKGNGTVYLFLQPMELTPP